MYKFKFWEKVIILFSIFLFSFSFFIYFSDFPLRNYLFHLSENESQTLIGHITQKDGTILRQISGETEFKNLDINAPLYDMDVIVSNHNSTGKLRFENGTIIEIGPDTMVRLRFPTDYSISGIKRYGKIEVVTGKVTGQASKQKLVITKQHEVLIIKPNTSKAIEVKAPPVRPHPIPKLSPRPGTSPISMPSFPPRLPLFPTLSASPTPKASPSPTRRPKVTKYKIKIFPVQVNNQLQFNPTTLKSEKAVQFSWTMEPPDEDVLIIVWKMNKTAPDKKSSSQVVLRRPIAPTGTLTHLDWAAKTPGDYRWKIETLRGDPLEQPENAMGDFRVEPRSPGIQPLSPLVGGQSVNNNQLAGDSVSNFNITLQWEPYKEATFYNVWISLSPDISKHMTEKTVTTNSLTFNNKINSNQFYYKIFAQLNSGFIVESDIQKFIFNFSPPTLANPQDNSIITYEMLDAQGGNLLLTWHKTNFTAGYEIEISHDPTFNSIYQRTVSRENFYILRSPPPGQYWWRVRSFSKTISSPWENAFTFTISTDKNHKKY